MRRCLLVTLFMLMIMASLPTASSAAVPDVVRLAGPERIATAVSISNSLFPDGGAPGAILARADIPADALAATALADRGPLLLTKSDVLSEATVSELGRAVLPGATVILAGGEAAISNNVAGAVRRLGFVVQRLGGSNRFATAATIASEIPTPSTIFVADGGGFADALLAGTAAGRVGGVSSGKSSTAETDAYLAENQDVLIVGVGKLASATGVVDQAIFGLTDYETSAAMAARFGGGSTTLALATGEAFPDALAGGVYAATLDMSLLLTERVKLPQSTSVGLLERQPDRLIVFGGTAAVADEVVGEAIRAACPAALTPCEPQPTAPFFDVRGQPNGTVVMAVIGNQTPEDLLGRPPTFTDLSWTGSDREVRTRWQDRQGNILVIRADRVRHIQDRDHNVDIRTIVGATQSVNAVPEEDPNSTAVNYLAPVRLFQCSFGGLFLVNCETLAEETIKVVYDERLFDDGDQFGVVTAFCDRGDPSDRNCPDWVNQHVQRFPTMDE